MAIIIYSRYILAINVNWYPMVLYAVLSEYRRLSGNPLFLFQRIIKHRLDPGFLLISARVHSPITTCTINILLVPQIFQLPIALCEMPSVTLLSLFTLLFCFQTSFSEPYYGIRWTCRYTDFISSKNRQDKNDKISIPTHQIELLDLGEYGSFV